MKKIQILLGMMDKKRIRRQYIYIKSEYKDEGKKWQMKKQV